MINEKDLWYATGNHIPVLGHRGICEKYPENTMLSFRKAIDLGVDLIEYDVNMTKDGQLVVIHDSEIRRTSDHSGLTRNYTLEELKSFDFGGYFGEEFKGLQIPTLSEVLTLVKNSCPNLLMNVEIKDMTHETVDKTVEMLKQFGLADRSVIACFNAEIIRYTKTAFPEIRTQGFPGRYMINFTEETYDCMFGMGIPIHWGDDEASIRRDIAFAKERGILAWLFTADTEESVKYCVKLGADNITGNNPEIALTTLRALGKHR